VDVLGHPTGRRLLKRDAYKVDMDRILSAAAARGVAVEINCQIERLDLNEHHARAARDRGIGIIISTDAHSRTAFSRLEWGVRIARRAWLTAGDVLNTLPADQFRSRLRRNRTAA
jgi:DNA polymerase (family 10)